MASEWILWLKYGIMQKDSLIDSRAIYGDFRGGCKMTHEEMVISAMKSNEIEGHVYSEEDKALIMRYAKGELTEDEMTKEILALVKAG